MDADIVHSLFNNNKRLSLGKEHFPYLLGGHPEHAAVVGLLRSMAPMKLV
ncbi:MAG: hypothetical protein ABIE47_12365 [Pseudomonadota bacterium]